jgi:hypothetical protein
MPPYRRDIPASSAAAVKVGQERVTSDLGAVPGSTLEEPERMVTPSPKRSLPVKRRRISAPAALKVLWPEEYSWKGGVGKDDGWYGAQS